MRLVAAIPAMLFAAHPVSAAADPVPLTKESIRTMPPDELARRVFGELGHVMYPLPYREPSGAFARMPLQALQFLTRPRGSYRAGLCETDRIIVAFEPVPFVLGDDPPVRPYHFQVYDNHFVLDFEEARQGGPPADSDAEAELRAACAATDPRGRQLVSAQTAFEIVAGLDALADLVEAAREGRALAPLECIDSDGQAIAEADCLRDLARVEPMNLYHAALIPGCDRRSPQVYCRWLEVHNDGDGLDIQIEFPRGANAPTRVRVKPVFDESSIAA